MQRGSECGTQKREIYLLLSYMSTVNCSTLHNKYMFGFVANWHGKYVVLLGHDRPYLFSILFHDCFGAINFLLLFSWFCFEKRNTRSKTKSRSFLLHKCAHTHFTHRNEQFGRTVNEKLAVLQFQMAFTCSNGMHSHTLIFEIFLAKITVNFLYSHSDYQWSCAKHSILSK